MHLVCQNHYSCTSTQSHDGKRQILFGYEVYKHLAVTILGGLLALYLSFLAQKGAKITDKKLRKITNRLYIVCNCLVF